MVDCKLILKSARAGGPGLRQGFLGAEGIFITGRQHLHVLFRDARSGFVARAKSCTLGPWPLRIAAGHLRGLIVTWCQEKALQWQDCTDGWAELKASAAAAIEAINTHKRVRDHDTEVSDGPGNPGLVAKACFRQCVAFVECMDTGAALRGINLERLSHKEVDVLYDAYCAYKEKVTEMDEVLKVLESRGCETESTQELKKLCAENVQHLEEHESSIVKALEAGYNAALEIHLTQLNRVAHGGPDDGSDWRPGRLEET